MSTPKTEATVARAVEVRRESQDLAASVTGRLAGMRQAIAEQREALRWNTHALPQPGELIATAERLVDEVGEHWWRENGETFLRRLAGLWQDPALASSSSPTLRQAPILPFSSHEPMTDEARCALEPEAVKDMYRAAIHRPYDAGAPAAERPALLARLAAALAAAEAEEERFVDEMNASGFGLEHRSEVVARKQQEAQAAQLAEKAADDRRSREAAVNQQHERHRGPVASPYLEQNAPRRLS